jgi:hypothetical protein
VTCGTRWFSKERRLEPQITIGLLTDATWFPSMLNAFERNQAETTMLPVIQAFQGAHHLTDVTVVVDAGMVSAANQKAIEDAGLPTDPARARRAGDQGRERSRRQDRSQTQPVRETHRRNQEREPGPGDETPPPGGD